MPKPVPSLDKLILHLQTAQLRLSQTMHKRLEPAPEPEMVQEMALVAERVTVSEIVETEMVSGMELETETEIVQVPDNKGNRVHLPKPLPFVKLRRVSRPISLLDRVAIVPDAKTTAT
jgi:hypothetical protein